MKKIRLAIIGLGARAMRHLSIYETALSKRNDIDYVAVCDPSEEAREFAVKRIKEEQNTTPKAYADYRQCIDDAKPDVAIVVSSWDSHLEISTYALRRGVAVAVEVGGGYSLEELWNLVRCYEETKTPIMFLENCCYGRMETLALNMKRLGVLGEIVYCEGGYRHDLRNMLCVGMNNGNYRTQEYLRRNCENYPSHEIGPIAKLLDINCGNRFVSLTSVATKSCGLKDFAKRNQLDYLEGVEFKQGDIVSTTIKCQNGEVVHITLDTTLPRFYSRSFTVQGTRGFISEDLNGAYVEKGYGGHVGRDKVVNNIDEYYKEYEHPLWKDYIPEKEGEGHDGIDYLIFDEFFKAYKTGAPMPIDIYDMVTWLSISVLSEQSITTGQTVYFPDFTNGKWINRKNNFLL